MFQATEGASIVQNVASIEQTVFYRGDFFIIMHCSCGSKVRERRNCEAVRQGDTKRHGSEPHRLSLQAMAAYDF